MKGEEEEEKDRIKMSFFLLMMTIEE